MLVCNVSLRPPRRAIAAGITEAAAAADATASGNVVFATLVDDPASVGEIVDAYLGEIMLEAASASDVVDSGFVLVAQVDESGSAADTQGATITPAATTVTWDSATVTAVTLSGGDLVATNTGTTSANQGAHVASTAGKTTGKYYFEVTLTANTGGANRSAGIGTTASTYTNIGNSATTGSVVYTSSGSIWTNGGSAGAPVNVGGGGAAGSVFGVAADLDNRKIWFRLGASGNWNSASPIGNNPATNTGGVTIPAGTMVPFVTFGGTAGAANNVFTANFGGSTFTGAVPSGFTSGWPV